MKPERAAAALALLTVACLAALGLWLATPGEPEIRECDHCNHVAVPGEVPPG
jgi:hypothetical protein